jgi:hypothetical protein
MSLFDPYITKVSQYTADLRRKGRKVHEFDCPKSINDLLSGLPVRVGPKAGSELLYRNSHRAGYWLDDPGCG